MRKYFTVKFISIALIGLLVIIQVFRVDTTNPPVISANEFVNSETPTQVVDLLKISCYDCHSNTTTYPWYTQIAPVSWWLKNHVNEGRSELNFSEWTKYSAKKADHKLEECIEMLQEDEMPLASYTWMHKDAKLNSEQKKLLLDYFSKRRSELGGGATEEE